jgi:hypothetical protein
LQNRFFKIVTIHAHLAHFGPILTHFLKHVPKMVIVVFREKAFRVFRGMLISKHVSKMGILVFIKQGWSFSEGTTHAF